MDALIRTKLEMPPLGVRMVERPLLLDRLSDGRSSRLLVISGIAGSGKTSLASQWLLRDGVSAAWYSLDKTDNDSTLFLRYLLASFAFADERLASLIKGDLRAGKAFTEKHIVSQIISRVAEIPADVYLVLDDYHVITSRAVHNVVSTLLARMPPNLHVVILTRYAVPFPLSPLRMRNQITEISASEMRFTEHEAERFFSEVMPVNLTTEEAREVGRHMEGWVGGLQLFGLSFKEKGASEGLDVALARGSMRVSEFLIDEIIAVQPPKVRAFLEATAPLDRFDAACARAVTGMEDAGEMIDTVYRNNLLLVPLDAEHKWYRYHQILSEAIKKRLAAGSPGKLSRVFQRAATWFAKSGFLEDAFRDAFASEDFEFAADLLEEYLLFINDRHEYSSGRRWLSRLPREVFMKRTLLRLHDCGQKVDSFQLNDIEAVIRDIERDPEAAFAGYKGEKRVLCEDLFVYFKHALYYYYRNPAHPDLGKLEEAARTISHGNRLFSGYTKILISLGQGALGFPARAEAALDEAYPMIVSSGSPWARTLWFREYSVVQRTQGRLNKSEAVLRQASEFLEQTGTSETPLRYVLYLPMGWLYYHRNDLEKASEYASAAERYGEHVDFAKDIAEASLLLSLVHAASGKMKQAEDYLHKVRVVAEERGVADTGVAAESWLARLSMAGGDLHEALEWARGKDFSPGTDITGHLVHDYMTYAELLMRQRLYREADALLRKMRPLCVERNMMKAVLDVDIASSAAAYWLKERERARQTMERALAFAEAEGYLRPFLDHAPGIFHLLSDMKRMELPPRLAAHLRKIMAACAINEKGLVGSTRRFEDDKSRQLTAREMEVLRMMAAGVRYKEIAERTFVSFETIKSHARHIFEKLDVSSKAQAIRRAQDLRLLD
jgi:LuxR family maltose regulon positive regulatory protein